MRKAIAAVAKLIFGIGSLVGLIYLPADILGLDDTYPMVRWVLSTPRETLLIWFSAALVTYLVYAEARPFLAAWRASRAWLPYPDAAQVIYERLADNDMVAGLIRASDHPRPVEAVMAYWIEDGLSNGLIKMRGRREHGTEFHDVGQRFVLAGNLAFERKSGGWDDEIAAQDPDNKEAWRGLRVSSASLKKYIKWLETDESKTPGGNALGKKSSPNPPSR